MFSFIPTFCARQNLYNDHPRTHRGVETLTLYNVNIYLRIQS